MSFLQRLGYFGFGVGMGCLLVYALLIRDRDLPAWLPEGRVLEQITSGPMNVAPDVHLGFADSLLLDRIQGCEVLFRESVVRDTPCKEYQLQSEWERMRFRICNDTVELIRYERR